MKPSGRTTPVTTSCPEDCLGYWKIHVITKKRSLKGTGTYTLKKKKSIKGTGTYTLKKKKSIKGTGKYT